jgi:hypothetical protein
VFFEESQHSGRVADITDIDGLPRRSQQNAWPGTVSRKASD